MLACETKTEMEKTGQSSQVTQTHAISPTTIPWAGWICERLGHLWTLAFFPTVFISRIKYPIRAGLWKLFTFYMIKILFFHLLYQLNWSGSNFRNYTAETQNAQHLIFFYLHVYTILSTCINQVACPGPMWWLAAILPPLTLDCWSVLHCSS